MGASIIEGIDNEVLFVVSVFLALLTIFLVQLVFKSNRNNARQNESNFSPDSDSAGSSRPEDATQENTTEGTESADTGPVSEDLNQTSTLQPHNDVVEEDTSSSQSANDTTFPQMDRMSDEVRWRRPAESTASADDQSSIPEDNISIRVKYLENERTISVNRTITVGELKRLCFLNDLNSGRRVRLIYCGHLLQDDTASLSFYGVGNYSVVHAQISDPRRSPNEQSAGQNEEEDLDISKLFLPLLAVILIMSWFGLFYYRHLFSATSIIILVFVTLAYGFLVHVMTS